jgi:hypothetical protein
MPREFSQHVALFGAYAEAVAALSPAAWDRLVVACAPLDGAAISAVVDRARLTAKAYVMESASNVSRAERRIAAIATNAITGIGVVTELVGEFTPRSGIPPTRPTVPRSDDPRVDAYVEGWFTMTLALVPFENAHPGVAAAVRAAGQAVLRHDHLSPATFAEVYGYVEAEIPFDSIEQSVASGDAGRDGNGSTP